MRRWAWRWLLAALAAGSFACATFMAGLVPLPTPHQIRIPHTTHADMADCSECHAAVAESAALEGHSLLPKEEVCMGCHDDIKEEGNCGFCHVPADAPATFVPVTWNLKFSHANHIERVEGECARCHASLPDPFRTPEMAPTMDTCLGCHNHQADYDAGRCDRCHIDLSRYPLRPVAGFSHDGGFFQRHRAEARASIQSCASCHPQLFCNDCHSRTAPQRVELTFPERVDRKLVHRDDWLVRHPIEAGANAATCSRCHATNFCNRCHRDQNLTPKGSDPRNPHPPGWVFPGGTHGTEARRNITRCAACHADGPSSICVDCHRVGGVGGDPHPLGWRQRHTLQEAGQNGMCLYCHL